jgi:glycyl-tRNA synthetase beta chain
LGALTRADNPLKLLFEIGTEEMPAGSVMPSLEFLARELARRAGAERLEHGAIEPFATPRRLALRVSDVAARTPDVEETRLGPAARVAFDGTGQPTKAALGFARGQGLEVDELVRVITEKGEYVAARRVEPGRPAAEVLARLLGELVAAIPWPKPMRWGWSAEAWGRPVHWLVALLEGEVLRVEFAGVAAGRTTYGHRFEHPGGLELAGPDDYEAALREAQVWVSVAERREEIWRRVQEVAAPDSAVLDEGLLDEVTQLVEQPLAAVGTFDEAYLELPREVLVSEMRAHQRYFAVEGAGGRLVNRFVVVYNTRVRDVSVVVHGNRRVLAARLADGRFFLRRDQARPLHERVPDLARVVFMTGLGTLRDKVERVERLAETVAGWLFPDAVALARRAAHLCKADLTTEMVGEFPELQGVMGREYARHDGEDEAVAVALAEHYQPRGATDAPPLTPAGICVALADRADTLAGCFALGLVPSGTADPYGLRRAALGILRTALEHGLVFSLRALLEAALEGVAKVVAGVDGAATAAALEDFVGRRLKGLLLAGEGGGTTPDVVDAVLATGLDDIGAAAAKVRALASMRQREDFEPLAAAFKRVTNILKETPQGAVDAALFAEEAEGELWSAYREVRTKVEGELTGRDYAAAVATLLGLKRPVDRFFDDVLVMDGDPAVRNNRLAMLRDLKALFEQLADISRIQVGP